MAGEFTEVQTKSVNKFQPVVWDCFSQVKYTLSDAWMLAVLGSGAVLIFCSCASPGPEMAALNRRGQSVSV